MMKGDCNETELERCGGLKRGSVATGALVVEGILVTDPACADHWSLKPYFDGEQLGKSKR